MRTAELIGLLRSQDRNKPVVSDHLAQLDNTRQLHLLGELSNWLLVELHKYQDRQTGLNDLETLQQGSIHSQIRHTLKAILTIIQSITISTTNANSGNSEYAASVTPVSTKHSQKQKTVLPLDDRDKERILDGFLRPVLIGVVPLGPRVDSTDVQLLCAKILCICTSPLTVNPPFPPQEFTKYMFSISASYSTLHSKTRGDNQANGTSIAHAQRGNDADVILALSSLLGSTSIKLQEYGLRILTSHKFITKEKFAWEILPSLRSVLEDFKNDLVAIQTSSMSIFETNHTSANPNSESTVKDENSARKHNSQSGDSSSIGIRSKALLILQSFQQEAGRSLTPLSVASTQQPIDRHVKPAQLDEAAPMSLLIDLWKNIQEIFFFDKAALPSCDRIILALCGTIYWSCWFSQEWGFGMVMLIEQGMETLLAWYGYYITSHDDGDHNGENNVDSSLSIATAQTLAQKKESNSTILEKEDDMRHQACVLEYLTKLIGILVSNKSNNKALYSGYPRPVGLTIVRRTIEFFNDLTTTSNRTSTAGASSIPAILSSPSPANTSTTNSVAQVSTAVQLIKIKPGILEAMLGIINSCFGSKKALDDLIIFSRVPNVLVMLLSESNSNELFRTPTKEFPEAMSRRFMSLALAILPGFLKRGSQNTWTEDVTWNEWTVGYTALTNRIMLPVEQEAEITRHWLLEPHMMMETISSLPPIPLEIYSDAEIGLKALKLFGLFWKYHRKSRWLLSDTMGPRLFHSRMLYILTDQRDDATIAVSAPNSAGDTTARTDEWVKERMLLLIEIAACFGTESNIRLNMRERWEALPFLVALLGASIRRLNLRGYNIRETHCRKIAQKCFLALRNFWLDKQGLIQLADLNLGGEMEALWRRSMPTYIQHFSASNGPDGSTESPSIVPLLLSIIVPPKTEWSSELLLGGIGKRSRWWHPLLERNEAILVEASLLLVHIAPLPTCQQRLISRPGAIWMLSRIMVERSLVGTSFRNNRQNKPHSAGDNESDTSSLPHELVEKSLFDTLSKVMGSLESARAVVSNNTITELFAAILDIDHPLRFYCNKMHFELMEISDTTESVTNESDHHDKTMAPIENATGDSNLTAINTPLNLSNTTTPLNNGHIGSSPTTLLRAIDLILPTKRQQQLHCQLLHHFYQIMHPLQSQFERIYQYVGGRQGLAESNESSDSVFWMREYCALVFMYILTPPSSGTIMAPYFAWESKLDKTALLESESVLGVVCRMLTLEMVYDNEDEVESEFDITPAVGQDKAQDSKSNEENMNGVQREEALLRKFSSGLAFQSHGWRHVDRWRQQHLELVGTYSELMTMEWEAHVAKLSGAPLAGFTDAGTKEVTENLKRKNKAGDETAIPVVFSVQGRSLTFPDRECLSRVSPFFYTLLKGEFQESHQDTIVLHDVEPDNIELLLEILKESQVTSQHLLPKDLPLELVVQLMVCADRYLVSFVRRLAENWVLETLGELEMKEYDLCPTLQSDTIASNSRIESGATIALDGAKRMRSEDGLTRVRGNINGTTIDEKRPRLDPSKDIDLVDQSNRAAMEVVMSDDYDGHTETTPSSSSAFSFSSFTTSKEAATFEHGVSTATASKIIVDDNVIHSHDDQASLSGQQSPTNTEDNRDEEEQETLTIQDCLLIVYEACADPQFGSIYTTTHPFHGLVWDVLRRMMLRLGSVAIRPRFTTMLNRFGGERIQEFLQILYELAFDDSDSYLTSMTVE